MTGGGGGTSVVQSFEDVVVSDLIRLFKGETLVSAHHEEDLLRAEELFLCFASGKRVLISLKRSLITAGVAPTFQFEDSFHFPITHCKVLRAPHVLPPKRFSRFWELHCFSGERFLFKITNLRVNKLPDGMERGRVEMTVETALQVAGSMTHRAWSGSE